jgi:hypothetical protein
MLRMNTNFLIRNKFPVSLVILNEVKNLLNGNKNEILLCAQNDILHAKNVLLITVITLITLISGSTFAQIDKNGGSVYSIFGLGDLNYNTGLRSDGMGVMGISLFGDYTNTINPATWTRIPSTRFTTVFNFQNIRSSDGTNEAQRNYGNFGSFNLSVPANVGNGWIIDAGISPYSIVNYDIQFRGSSLGESFTQIYSGNGGLTRISFGFSYLLFKYFSFGAQFNYAFGNMTKSTTIDFDNSSLVNTKNNIQNSLSGFYFNTGLIFHGFGKLSRNKKLDDLAVGILFSTPYKLNSTIIGRYSNSVQTDSVNISDGKLEIPWAGGVGFSYIIDKRVTIAADVFMQNWDNYKYYGVHPVEIKNNMRIGAGLEFVSSRKIDDPWYKRVAYRLGGSYTSDYLRINGESINMLSGSIGLNIPFIQYNSIDILFSYSTRGKTSGGLVKDNVFRLAAGINIGELWFLKPKEE